MAKFKKGQSGNPKGRPKKGEAFSERIRKFLSDKNKEFANIEHLKDCKTREEALLKALYVNAMNGDDKNIKIIFEYAYGKPVQVNETDLNGELSIVLNKQVIK